jgi:hypothetical protein
MELPFICAKYRSRVRVVDFKPDKLEDFAHALDDPSYNDSQEDPPSSYDDLDLTPRRWEWAFCLLVEDALRPQNDQERPERLRLLVAKDGAECLLKLDATEYVSRPVYQVKQANRLQSAERQTCTE